MKPPDSTQPEICLRLPGRRAHGNSRAGEVTALRRCDVTEDAGTVRVARALVEVPGKGLIAGPPKSRAGVRELTVPTAIRADVLRHMEAYAEPHPSALLFTDERDGNALRRPNFNQRVKWGKVVANMGLSGLHFHDLRHAGNLWASKGGHLDQGPHGADGS